MTVKFNKFLDFFTYKADKNLENCVDSDFFKRSKTFLVSFITVFLAAIATLAFALLISKTNFNINNKSNTIIELPLEGELTEKNLKTIESVGCSMLKTNCLVQKTNAFEESPATYKDWLVVKCASISGDEDYKMQNIVSFVEKIKQMFPKNITIKNKEQILVSNTEAAQIERFNNMSVAVLAGTILLIILICFAFNFKKLNGVFVALTFLIALTFNFTAISAIFSFLIGMLGFQMNNMLLWAFVITTVTSSVNYLYNASIIFNKIKENKDEKDIVKVSNVAINKSIPVFIDNVVLFTVIPAVSILVFKIVDSITNTSSFGSFLEVVVFILLHLAAGIVCVLCSMFVLAQIWVKLKMLASNNSKKTKQNI